MGKVLFAFSLWYLYSLKCKGIKANKITFIISFIRDNFFSKLNWLQSLNANNLVYQDLPIRQAINSELVFSN